MKQLQKGKFKVISINCGLKVHVKWLLQLSVCRRKLRSMSSGTIWFVWLNMTVWHYANKAFVVLPCPHFNNHYFLSALPHILATSQVCSYGGEKKPGDVPNYLYIFHFKIIYLRKINSLQ